MSEDTSQRKSNPILILIGLAIAVIAVVAGITRDRWLPAAPQKTVTAEQKPATSGQSTVTEKSTAAKTAEVQPAETQASSEPAKTTDAATPPAETQASAKPAQTAAAQPAQEPAKSDKTAPAVTVPTFDTVRVEKSGEAVIAGRAAAGSQVTVMLDGKAVGSAVTNSEGSFVVVPDAPLPRGSGALTIESKGKNETVATKSEQTVAVIVPEQQKQDALVAVVSPDQPTKVLQAPATDGQAAVPAAKSAASLPASLDAVDYDGSGNIVFSGRGQPGTIARLYVDNGLAGEAKAGDDSRWSFAGAAPIKPGVHSLRVDALDAAGAVVTRIEIPFFREETTKLAAATTSTEASAAAQTETAAEPPKPKIGRIVIQPGNNLWRISSVIYGSGVKYTILFAANKDQIRNPDLIYPGQIFTTPDVVPPEKIDPARSDPLKPEEGGSSGQ
ncbi:MAG: LysM peptidoglycan-binding domain-containing protein [Rhizobiales bacterium]|nr:LysM peptidoglycan-binding domain-containing protein [Hyphomicrobiales bacterium]